MKLFRMVLIVAVAFAGVLPADAQYAPAKRGYIEVLVTPSSRNWEYMAGDTAKAEVRVLRNNFPVDGIEVFFEAGPEMLAPDTGGSIHTQAGKADITIGTSAAAGFRSCRVWTVYEGTAYESQVKAGFSVGDIKPVVKMPDGFRDYWDNIVRNRRHPRVVEMTPLPEYSTGKTETFLAGLEFGKGERIYGYLCKPRGGDKYPVVLNPPGAGVKPFLPNTEYADNGFISLSIEIHGFSPMLGADEYRRLNGLHGRYMYEGIGSPDTYYYRRVVRACLAAMDYLCGLDGFDGTNAGVCGGSQGGALSIATAALHPKVTFVSAFYPAMCDMNGYLHGRAGGWPNIRDNSRFPDTPVAVAEGTLAYYDVVNFARVLGVPGFYSFGYNDNTCSPTSVWSAVNSIEAPKTVIAEPVSGHWRFPQTNAKSLEWMKSQCK